jgi:hypothetical protein
VSPNVIAGEDAQGTSSTGVIIGDTKVEIDGLLAIVSGGSAMGALSPEFPVVNPGEARFDWSEM